MPMSSRKKKTLDLTSSPVIQNEPDVAPAQPYIEEVNKNNFDRLLATVQLVEAILQPAKRSRPTNNFIQDKAFGVSEALSFYERGYDTKTKSLLPYTLQQKRVCNTKAGRNLSTRARKILTFWREGIRTNDIISCPDYLDEYECNDNDRKWVRLFDATVLSYASGHVNKGMEISLGDSSVSEKKKYRLKEKDAAIRVHYDGFGASDSQWLLLKSKFSQFIIPYQSTKKSVLALKKINRQQVKRAKTMNQSISKEHLQNNLNQNTKSNQLEQKELSEKSKKSRIVKTVKRQGWVVDEASTRASKKVKTKDVFDDIKTFATKTSHRSEKCNSSIKEKREISLKQAIPENITEKRKLKKENSNGKVKEIYLNGTKTQDSNSSKKGKTMKDDFTWICTACGEAECAIEPDSPLLICEGPCRRLYHYPCAGLHSVPPEDQIWICTDCLQYKHQCSICSEYGVDDVDIFKCDKKNCGLFFHEGCLNTYNVEVVITDVQGQTKPRFRCPAHECWTCADGAPILLNKRRKNSKKKLLSSSESKSFDKKNGELFVSIHW